jgi:hypothetical protein
VSEKPPKERERKVWRRMWACARGREGRTGKFACLHGEVCTAKLGAEKVPGWLKYTHIIRGIPRARSGFAYNPRTGLIN